MSLNGWHNQFINGSNEFNRLSTISPNPFYDPNLFRFNRNLKTSCRVHVEFMSRVKDCHLYPRYSDKHNSNTNSP